MIALHLGGIPELAMFLGPILLIAAFLRIARRKEADAEDDDWNADLGDFADRDAPAGRKAEGGSAEPRFTGPRSTGT